MTYASFHLLEAELAQAAYGSYGFGAIDPNLLTSADVGMSSVHAARFAESWIVIDQYTDSVSGLSVTVFAPTNDPNARYLAIRGTEPTASDLTADGLLALGLPKFSPGPAQHFFAHQRADGRGHLYH